MPQFSFCFPFGSPRAQGLKLSTCWLSMSTNIPSISSSLYPVHATHLGQAHPLSSGTLSIREKSVSLISTLFMTDDFPWYFSHMCLASAIVTAHGKRISAGLVPKHISELFISFSHWNLLFIQENIFVAMNCLQESFAFQIYMISPKLYLQVLHAIMSYVDNAVFQTAKSPTIVLALLTQGWVIL